MTTVYLGNRDAHELIDGVPRPLEPGKRCTTVKLAPDLTPAEALNDLTGKQGVWQAHSSAPTPAWVACEDSALATLLAAYWQCELRDVEV